MAKVRKYRIRDFESSTSNIEANLAHVILSYAHLTAAALYDSFWVVREAKGTGGTPTDEQQDLLRSMLVLALAGLDASAKQLVEHALPALIERETVSADALLDFGSRRLVGLGEDAASNRLLLKLLINDDPAQRLVEEFVKDLTGDSLQSVEQMMRVVSVLGVESPALRAQVTGLREAFDVRNAIIHRMDMDFDFPNRNRTSRSMAKVVPMTNHVLEVAESVVLAVDELLTASEPGGDDES